MRFSSQDQALNFRGLRRIWIVFAFDSPGNSAFACPGFWSWSFFG